TAKAKALKMYVEPLITKTKDLTKVEEKTHAQRVVFSYLKNKYAVKELFGEIAEKVADRPGGYTRILKTGTRLGDNADMCIIELVDYNETYSTGKSAAKSKSTRRRRGTKKATAETTSEKVETKVEEVKAEETPVAETKVEEAPEQTEETEAKEEEKKEE
ncbi:MAG TPA: 50S ribosomal protein L17, partial [Bacteroidales bacterium]|nr:50S ribosomal protein L17 [Bacteroidales bacterium]